MNSMNIQIFAISKSPTGSTSHLYKSTAGSKLDLGGGYPKKASPPN